jgi:hypothetical protein
MSRKKTISHSALVLVRNCLRQYQHSYVHLRTGRSIAQSLAMGSIWDRMLTAWHWGKNPMDRLERAYAVLMQCPPGVMRETLKAMILGYTTRWGDAAVETRSTQLEFTAPIIHPETGEAHPDYDFHGILDGIVDVNGRLLGLESKTSSEDIEPGSTYWQRVTTLDPQVSMYLLGAKHAGYDIEAVLYDVARKPALRQGKDETPEAFGERVQRDIQARPLVYFQRQEIVRLESDERAYRQDLWDYACILSDAARLDRWPRNPDRCRQYGRVCDYIGACTGLASIHDDDVYQKREKRNDGTTEQNPKRTAA